MGIRHVDPSAGWRRVGTLPAQASDGVETLKQFQSYCILLSMPSPSRRAILSRAQNTLARSMLTVRRRRIGSAALKDHLFTFPVTDKRPVRVSSDHFSGVRNRSRTFATGQEITSLLFTHQSTFCLPHPPIETFVENKDQTPIRPDGRPSGRSPFSGYFASQSRSIFSPALDSKITN